MNDARQHTSEKTGLLFQHAIHISPSEQHRSQVVSSPVPTVEEHSFTYKNLSETGERGLHGIWTSFPRFAGTEEVVQSVIRRDGPIWHCTVPESRQTQIRLTTVKCQRGSDIWRPGKGENQSGGACKRDLNRTGAVTLLSEDLLRSQKARAQFLRQKLISWRPATNEIETMRCEKKSESGSAFSHLQAASQPSPRLGEKRRGLAAISNTITCPLRWSRSHCCNRLTGSAVSDVPPSSCGTPFCAPSTLSSTLDRTRLVASAAVSATIVEPRVWSSHCFSRFAWPTSVPHLKTD